MQNAAYVERLVNLLDPGGNVLLNMSYDDAVARVGTGIPQQVRQIDGQFALLHRQEKTIRMARSIGRPMRYFLAKQAAGPCLIVAERMDEIREQLARDGLSDQYHPSYTRMVPAHHVVELSLIGCPDPNPVYTRYLAPDRNDLAADLDVIGAAYIGALSREIDRWLDQLPTAAPIGVLFSGGVDSGSVLLTLYDRLLARGESPARLKAFTLAVDARAADTEQAMHFLAAVDLSFLLEVVNVPAHQIRYQDAISVIEDYKPLDVQSATMALALCRGIREHYPDWSYLVDGDGGDENLKDYPIEENPELTIRSVLSNLMLYQEGWGVDAIKHSLVYSGGQSRGHVRTSAPARTLGFCGFSPYALPNMISVAESIPFIELTNWDHQKLYALKGEIVRRGVAQVTGLEMPVFEKRRFQHGVVSEHGFQELFPSDESDYRDAFLAMHV